MFMKGRHYTRPEICRELGGSTQKYLPHVRGRVVCGCFRLDLNPDAPGEILPGDSADIVKWATVFARQGDPVPTFLKRETNKWEYVGCWRVCAQRITDPSAIAERQRRTGRSDISMLLNLEPATG